MGTIKFKVQNKQYLTNDTINKSQIGTIFLFSYFLFRIKLHVLDKPVSNLVFIPAINLIKENAADSNSRINKSKFLII